MKFWLLKSCPALLLLLCLQASWPAESACAAEPYTLTVVTDREDALYEVGEEATFLISVRAGDQAVTEGEVKFVIDDFLNSGPTADLPAGQQGLGDPPARVVVTGQQPGFLRCQVTYTPAEGKPLKAVAAVGFSPTKIQPSLPVPDDFAAYWADQKRQLANIPSTAEWADVKQKDVSIQCFDIQVPCLGGAPVSGYFARPAAADADANQKRLPAILWVHGAGVRSSALSNAIKGAQAGMLSMDINAHGIPNGEPAEFYAAQSAGPLKNYRYAGRENRDTIYFRGMFLRLVRAIDFLTAQPEWNGRDVIVIGHSQGGGQALAAGGLDDRVTLVASGVPAICDHSGEVAGRVNGWPKLVPRGDDGQPDPQVLEASRYVDAVNFASLCRADAIMSVGFVDSVCPPSSCYAAYNLLRGDKTIINEPTMGHAAPQHIHEAFFNRVLEHVQRSAAVPAP